ncbi:MAG: glycosyltransferase family 4 protein [Candidatus Promineifilaceae bacterium]
MRILHLIHQYPPDYLGGTELYTQQLAAQLAARGHDVSIFFRRDGEEACLEGWREESGVKVWAAVSRPTTSTRRFLATFGDQTLTAALTQVLQESRPDVVHVQHLMGLPADLISLLRQQGVPYLVTLHDFWWVCANAQLVTNYSQAVCAGPRLWLNCARCALARVGQDALWPLSPALAPLLALRAARLRAVLQGARRLIAPTRFVRDLYRGWGLPASLLQVIPHGIALPERMPPRTRPATSGLHVGYVGGIAWQKGVHVLVEAVNGMPADSVTLSIFGDLSAFPDYARKVQGMARHDGIHFAGQIDRQRLWQELVHLDVLVVPSLWYETAALVIQEAFAAGIPVLASDLGALAERVRPGVDGLLFPPGDSATLRAALLELWRTPEKLMQFSLGIAPVRTIADHVDEMETIYNHIL